MHRLLLCLWAPLAARAAWSVAHRLPNGTAFFSPVQNDTLPPLFQSDTPNLAVWGTDNVRAIAHDETDLTVWAITPSCLLQIQAGIARLVAGSCTAPPDTRDGPLLFARFQRLVALSVLRHTLVLIDAGRPRANILRLDPLRVTPFASYPAAMAVSLSPSSSRILLLLPDVAHLLANTSDRLASSPQGVWTSCLLLSDIRSYLLDADSRLWLWHHLHNTLDPLATATAASALARGSQGPYDAWAISLASETFQQLVAPPLLLSDRPLPVPPLWYQNGHLPQCPLGFVLLQRNADPMCHPAPPGSYASHGLLVPCPAGTHNPLPLATSSQACLPCPHGAPPATALCPYGFHPPASSPSDPPSTTLCIHTVAKLPPQSLLAAARNGTLFAAHAPPLVLTLLVSSEDYTLSTIPIRPDLPDAVSMALSPDEATIYLASTSGVLLVITDLGQSVRPLHTPPHASPIRAIACTAAYLWILHASLSPLRLSNHTLMPPLPVPDALAMARHESRADTLVVSCLHNGSLSLLVVTPSNTTPLVSYASPPFPPTSIARWPHATVAAVGHALLLLPDAPSSNWSLLAGDLHDMGHRDDDPARARFFLLGPILPIQDDRNPLAPNLLLWEGESSTCRLLWHHGHPPPPPRSCPQGEYLDARAACRPCPLAYWWNQDPLLGPCLKMADSISLDQGRLTITFRLAALLPASDPPHDMLCLATTVLAPSPPFFALAATDWLGRLWTSAAPLTAYPPPPARPSSRGLWVLCPHTVAPDANCTCPVPPLSLVPHGLSSSPWDRARQRLVGHAPSLYALRGNTLRPPIPTLVPLHVPAIHLPSDNSLPAHQGDTGACYVGWPAAYSCADPTLHWAYPSSLYPGGVCLPCPPGTWAPDPDDVACVPLLPTSILCWEGTYLLSERCAPCPPDTFTSTKMALACTPKTQTLPCPPGTYLHRGGSTADDTCVPCPPCPEGTMALPAATCTGNTTYPAYTCASYEPNLAGFAVRFLPPQDLDQEPSLRYDPCGTPPSNAQWRPGPRYDLCYFACQYAVHLAAVPVYAFYLNDEPLQENLFPLPINPAPPLLDAARAVCLPCNTSVCPPLMWRPVFSDGCGPPCLLQPSLCSPFPELHGCISVCESLPAHAQWRSTTSCTWECQTGWFLQEGRCMPCHASSCPPSTRYTDASCWSAAQDVCTPCPPRLTAASLLSAATCNYSCDPGFYNFSWNHPGCVPCPSTPYYCAPGFRPHCTDAGPCQPCPTPPEHATPLLANASACPAACAPGYHTLLAERVLTDNPPFLDFAAFQCQDCNLRTSLPCHRSSKPCLTSWEMACPPGTYAPPCDAADQPSVCLLCLPHHFNDGRFYVPYERPDQPPCQIACPPNTMLSNSECVACNKLLPPSPFLAIGYSSLWNATPARRWWPPAWDPPHLGPRPSSLPESRAGMCWPCPLPQLVAEDLDLYPLLDPLDPLCAPSQPPREVSVPAAQNHFLVLATVPPPLLFHLALSRRRLLVAPSCPPGAYPYLAWCSLCPPRHWCPGDTLPQPCPPFSTTRHLGSASPTQCLCHLGFQSTAHGCALVAQPSLPPLPCAAGHFFSETLLACSPCPAHTYGTVTGVCLECPQNSQSNTQAATACTCTFSTQSTSCPPPPCPWDPLLGMCMCGPGTQPSPSGCELCPAGTYSSHIGMGPCLPCPAGIRRGTTRVADCLANP